MSDTVGKVVMYLWDRSPIVRAMQEVLLIKQNDDND